MDYEKEINHYELRVGDRIERYDNYLKMKEKFREYLRSRRGKLKIRGYAIFNDDTFMEVLSDLSVTDINF
jgi:hypothetical protein